MVQFKDYMISIRIEDCDNWLAHNEAKIFCDAMRFKILFFYIIIIPVNYHRLDTRLPNWRKVEDDFD